MDCRSRTAESAFMSLGSLCHLCWAFSALGALPSRPVPSRPDPPSGPVFQLGDFWAGDSSLLRFSSTVLSFSFRPTHKTVLNSVYLGSLSAVKTFFQTSFVNLCLM